MTPAWALSVVVGLWTLACGSSASRAPSLVPKATAQQSDARPPARLRRLSNAELRQTLSALVGQRVQLPRSFPPDVRVQGYSANGQQGVSAVFLGELHKLAQRLAEQAARERLSHLAPCSAESPNCDAAVVERLATRAFRRAPSSAERSQLAKLFARGRKQSGFAGGVELLLQTLMASPSLLYASEVGTPTSPGRRRLTSTETASVLAYALTGGPPDERLRRAGSEGALRAPAERERQALRLLSQSNTRYHFRRFVREWLGLGALLAQVKPVPNDEQLRLSLLAETDAFVDEVLMYEGASLDRLLLAGFTVLPASLRAFQGLPAASDPSHYGRVRLAGSGRLGILQQPSFLAVHSHEDETAPVLRGKAILERLLCVDLPKPSELGIVVTFPPRDPGATTRERHAAHTLDAQCKACHGSIDAIGFAFENFDPVGRLRTTENRKRIDTYARYSGPEGPRSFQDSRDVSRWLAQTPRAHECFARQAFRYFSGYQDERAESAFLELRRSLPSDDQRDLLRLLVAFAGSPLFVERRAPVSVSASASARPARVPRIASRGPGGAG